MLQLLPTTNFWRSPQGSLRHRQMHAVRRTGMLRHLAPIIFAATHTLAAVKGDGKHILRYLAVDTPQIQFAVPIFPNPQPYLRHPERPQEKLISPSACLHHQPKLSLPNLAVPTVRPNHPSYTTCTLRYPALVALLVAPPRRVRVV